MAVIRKIDYGRYYVPDLEAGGKIIVPPFDIAMLSFLGKVLP